MRININKQLPLSIKDQLKNQIRGMINSGTLQPGQSLLSCNDLSRIISVNRNTVAGAYSELCAEGVLTSNRGAGTIVNKTITAKVDKRLKSFMDSAIVQARKRGYGDVEITDQFFSSLAEHSTERKKKLLLVWCNRLTAIEVAQKLESTLGVETKSLVLEEIENDPGHARSSVLGVDLVVTSLNYIERILPFAEKMSVDVAGIILTPVTRILNELVRLPRGTTVGFTCVNDVAAESTCKSIYLSGNITLNTIWAGADDSERLAKMIAQCKIVFATHHVYKQVLQVAGSDKQVIKVDASITDASIEMISERLRNTS